ncbi:helix-turn-helix domain-containing protein [Promicromonospora umidemergens]|uniref:helix-turn-helix domain-containing protein n=1 Tax=Promicromonospora umidemergens TaxID=629679 RepID=UPI0027E37EFB|nr:helix-turn-helix domain-containing protein [Promicromonospora umidemergens]
MVGVAGGGADAYRGQPDRHADAAEHFHVSVKTLRRRIADGTIAGYRVGRLIRVDLDELTQSLVGAIPSARSV